VLRALARHWHDGRFALIWMHEDRVLDLERRDVLAAAPKRVLQSVDVEVVAVGVPPEEVAGVEPAVAPRSRRGLCVVELTMTQRPRLIRADDQLARRAERHLDVVLVDKPELEAGPRPAARARHGGARS